MTNDPPVVADTADDVAGTFASLGLSPELVRAIDKLGWKVPSPIQARAIPALLGGADIVGQSQTGSGKTAAFALPAIEKVDPSSKATQVLILVPTRELATQVAAEVEKLATFRKGIRTVTVYGGASYDRQFADLGRGAQIVVGTPGRLVDHLGRNTLDLGLVTQRGLLHLGPHDVDGLLQSRGVLREGQAAGTRCLRLLPPLCRLAALRVDLGLKGRGLL